MNWRVIPGLNNKYMISDTGQIKSIDKNHYGLILPKKVKQNRYYVSLYQKEHLYTYFVDELVAKTYLDTYFDFCIIEHKDRNTYNDSLDNLKCVIAIPDLPGELWEDVENLKGHLKVSNLGRVKRVDHRYNRPEHLITFVPDHDGYCTFGVSINGNGYSYKLHRLVAQTFIPNPDNKPQVNHKNGIKQDNRVENLEWCTAKENMQHAVKIGLHKNDSTYMKRKNAELRSTSLQCVETGEIFESIKEASQHFNVSRGVISDIARGTTKNSKHLPNIHFMIIKKGDKTK